MDTKQINDALDRIFHEEGQRIVFWNDPEKEFQNILPYLMLDNVNVLRLNEIGAMEVKIRLERDDPAGKYLLYSPAEEPNFEDDWLLDIRLYSRGFRADRASIILDELGLANQHLRATFGRPSQVLRQQGTDPENQAAGRSGRYGCRLGPQDDLPGGQGRSAGTFQHHPNAVPRLHGSRG